MKIIRTAAFAKLYKKLHSNERAYVDDAIRDIIANPKIGQVKTANLSDIRVYKFMMLKQLTLIAYVFEENILTLTLLSFGSHENFYRDLKKQL